MAPHLHRNRSEFNGNAFASGAFHAKDAFGRIRILEDVEINRAYSGTTLAGGAIVFINGDMNNAESVEQAEKSAKGAENPAKGPFYPDGHEHDDDQSQGFDKKKPSGKLVRQGTEQPVPDRRIQKNIGITRFQYRHWTDFAESRNGQKVGCASDHAQQNDIFNVGEPPGKGDADTSQPEQNILEKAEGAEQSAAEASRRYPEQGYESENIAGQSPGHDKILEGSNGTGVKCQGAGVTVEHGKENRLQSSLINAERLESVEMAVDKKQGGDLADALKRPSGNNVFHGSLWLFWKNRGQSECNTGSYDSDRFHEHQSTPMQA